VKPTYVISVTSDLSTDIYSVLSEVTIEAAAGMTIYGQ